MGRLWQTLILGQWNDLFYLLPIESLIKDHQDRYYHALEAADRKADSTGFIEFILNMIATTLNQTQARGQNALNDQASDQASDQVKRLLALMGDRYWSTQELIECLSLTHRPTFRKNYLNPALQAGLIVMQYPDSPRSPKQTYKKHSLHVDSPAACWPTLRVKHGAELGGHDIERLRELGTQQDLLGQTFTKPRRGRASEPILAVGLKNCQILNLHLNLQSLGSAPCSFFRSRSQVKSLTVVFL